jgi:hypothetical protein
VVSSIEDAVALASAMDEERQPPAGGAWALASVDEAVGVAGGVTALKPSLVDPQAAEVLALGKNRGSTLIPPPSLAASMHATQAPTPSG